MLLANKMKTIPYPGILRDDYIYLAVPIKYWWQRSTLEGWKTYYLAIPRGDLPDNATWGDVVNKYSNTKLRLLPHLWTPHLWSFNDENKVECEVSEFKPADVLNVPADEDSEAVKTKYIQKYYTWYKPITIDGQTIQFPYYLQLSSGKPCIKFQSSSLYVKLEIDFACVLYEFDLRGRPPKDGDTYYWNGMKENTTIYHWSGPDIEYEDKFQYEPEIPVLKLTDPVIFGGYYQRGEGGDINLQDNWTLRIPYRLSGILIPDPVK